MGTIPLLADIQRMPPLMNLLMAENFRPFAPFCLSLEVVGYISGHFCLKMGECLLTIYLVRSMWANESPSMRESLNKLKILSPSMRFNYIVAKLLKRRIMSACPQAPAWEIFKSLALSYLGLLPPPHSSSVLLARHGPVYLRSKVHSSQPCSIGFSTSSIGLR